MFTREDWARLREDTPMTLVPRDLEQLSGLIEELSMAEVEQIYLPMSRLLNLYVARRRRSCTRRPRGFSGSATRKVPFIIGIAGSVAVGKSTTARVLQGAAGALAGSSARRSHHDRRLPAIPTRSSSGAG